MLLRLCLRSRIEAYEGLVRILRIIANYNEADVINISRYKR